MPPDWQGPPRPEPDAVRERPVLPQDRRRDAAGVRLQRPRRRVYERGGRRRGPGRQPRDRGQVPAGDPHGRAPDAALPHPPGVQRHRRLSTRAHLRRCAQALARDHRSDPRAAGPGAGRHRVDGLRRLLPDRPGLYHRRPPAGRERRARPRLGGGLSGGLLLGDHQHRPAPVRPPVRALPEPRARVDARHRHRLRRPRAGQGHRLRRGEVRARVGLPDRDVRDDGLEVGHPRRVARDGRAAPRGRPHRQADPRRRQGVARGRQGAGLRVRQALPGPGPEHPQADALCDRAGGLGAAHGRPRGRRHHRARRREPVRPRLGPEGQVRRRRRRGHTVRRQVHRGLRAPQDGFPGPQDPDDPGRRAGAHQGVPTASTSTWTRRRWTTPTPTGSSRRATRSPSSSSSRPACASGCASSSPRPSTT